MYGLGMKNISMRNRDYQQSRVYAWEHRVVHCRCKRHLDFRDAQGFVDGIFLCEGLFGPPTIGMKPKQATTFIADGCRNVIRIPEEGIKASIMIHELAHAMTMDQNNNGDRHGPEFVGMYIKLLDKYMGIHLALTMYTLQSEKIDYTLTVQPRFSDQYRKASVK
jgi:hypothetical protein